MPYLLVLERRAENCAEFDERRYVAERVLVSTDRNYRWIDIPAKVIEVFRCLAQTNLQRYLGHP